MPLTIECPACQRKLRVPEKLLGKRVKCPSCGEAFEAFETPEPETPKKLPSPPAAAITPTPKRVPASFDYQEDDEKPEAKPRRRRPRDDDDEDDDDDDDDDDRGPTRRRRRDDDDDDARPRRRRRRPHRGGLILTLGIISLVVWCCPLAGWIMGAVVLNMANNDLAAMDSRHMDDSGRTMTTSGKICAIVAVALATLNAIAGAILRITNNI